MTLKRFLLSLGCVLALAFSARAEDLFAYRDSVAGGYDFLLYVPDSYADTTKEIPLIICLHGGSLRGSNLEDVTRYGCIDALRRGRDIDALILCPQLPAAASGWTADKVIATLDWVESRYRYDKNRLYVMGLSMGGWGVFKLLAASPGRFAAGIAMCGGYLGDVDPLVEVPLWIIHGTHDEVTRFAHSERIFNAMTSPARKAPRVIASWLMDCNHSILARIYLLTQPYDWLFSHALTDERRPVSREYSIEPRDLHRAYVELTGKTPRRLPVRKPPTPAASPGA